MIALMATKGKSKLAQRIKKYRKLSGFSSPAQLAETINNPAITKSTIINLEQGRKADLSITELLLFAKAFSIPATALVCDLDDPFGHPDVSGFEQYYNADIVDLFGLNDGKFGPQTDTSRDKSLCSASEASSYLKTIYFYMNYLASGLDQFRDAYVLYEKAKLEDDKEEMHLCTIRISGAKRVIQLALQRLPQSCGIEVPEEIQRYAKRVVSVPIDED